MKVARFQLSTELLRETLCLPRTTEIVSVEMAPDRYTTYPLIEVTVRDPDLRDVELAEDEPPPLVTPSFQKNLPVEFVSWNQKDRGDP